jgi:YHS domain-containing protein
MKNFLQLPKNSIFNNNKSKGINMKTSNLMALLLMIMLIFSLNVFAQDSKVQQEKSKKTEAVKDIEGCSDTPVSCCGSTQKTAATVTPWNEVCPVMGNKIDPAVKLVEYKGKLYGFCCDGCDDKFAQDPAKFSRNLSKDGKKFSKARS